MNEQLISLETSKLAKEKGFDRIKIVSKNNIEAAYNAPTQSLLQKWIREVHNIHVCVDLSCITFEDGNNKWFYRIDDVITNDYLEHSEDENLQFNKFEEALEIGLLKALQLIK